MESQPAKKKRKLSTNLHETSINGSGAEHDETVASSSPDASPHMISSVASTNDGYSNINTLSRSISPPARRTPRAPDVVETSRLSGLPASLTPPGPKESSASSSIKLVSSPVQLSRIQELPTSNNIDTVSLKDILGDPLIKECWAFNYLFDVDFLM